MKRLLSCGAATAALVTLALSPVEAQITYSVDWQSAGAIGALDSGSGFPITEGDILVPPVPGGPPVPAIFISGGFGPPAPGLGLPLHPPAVGHPPGVPGGVEVDALSYGTDQRITQQPVFPEGWVFSVDEFGWGLQPPPALPPNVSTEGASAYPAAAPYEASADIFGYFPPGAIPPGLYPFPPFLVPPGNTDILDGDGAGPIGPFSLGLLEPNFPVAGPVDLGDNLDAFDVDTGAPAAGLPVFPVYYSLDGPGFDPIDGFPNTASAAANGGFSGADILVTPAPGAGPVVHVPAIMLGLDLMGFDTDDVDALVYWDNGNGVYDPPTGPYSWEGANPTDMLFFSVRRGSAVVLAFTPDFFFGIPIEEGDILMPPPAAGAPPGIWLAAESLGLHTLRSIGPTVFGPFGDDLNALDTGLDCDDDGTPDAIAIVLGLGQDCNNNGILDACDIASGMSLDCQPNGIPDECDIDPTDPDGDGLVSPDCNCNGVPDECDLATGCLHDADGDGIPDECECPADTNCDGQVDVTDLLKVLADWGQCP